jgi:hypothetical protein
MTRRRFPSTKRQVGVHAGGELSWLFNGAVGVGGFARFSRASVGVTDPFRAICARCVLVVFRLVEG